MRLTPPPSGFPGTPGKNPANLQPGDRVRTTVVLTSDTRICGCDPSVCRDLPAGSLGTVERVSPYGGYGVMLDDDVHRLGVHLDPGEVERAPAE